MEIERKAGQLKNGKEVSGLDLAESIPCLPILDISRAVTGESGYFVVMVGGHSVVRTGGHFEVREHGHCVGREEDIVCVVIKEVG